MTIKDVSNICNVTNGVIDGYELDRYYPSIEVLDKLSDKFDLSYLCRDGYTYLLFNYDSFVIRLNDWINQNCLTKQEAAEKIGISRSLLRYWLNGSVIRSGTYDKIKDNLIKYKFI